MIALSKLRELNIIVAAGNLRAPYLSAASGLICLNSVMYVVADDELHLGVFSTDDGKSGHLIRLSESVPPESKPLRKRDKPDFEALALLPAFGDFSHGALLAIGSGSRPNRRTGVVLGLDPHGVIDGSPREVDLSSLLLALGEEFPEVNIEGAVVVGDELRLFQRGNKGHADNAIMRFQLSSILDALNTGRADAIKPIGTHRLNLGEVEGIPLCFTDAASLPGGDMVFSAVAEDTDNAVDDGTCIGAAIGSIDNAGRLRWLRPLDRPYKVEGIHARLNGDQLELLLITDADNPEIPATLFSATTRHASDAGEA